MLSGHHFSGLHLSGLCTTLEVLQTLLLRDLVEALDGMTDEIVATGTELTLQPLLKSRWASKVLTLGLWLAFLVPNAYEKFSRPPLPVQPLARIIATVKHTQGHSWSFRCSGLPVLG